MLLIDELFSQEALLKIRENIPPSGPMPPYGSNITSFALIRELESVQRKELERLATSIVFNNFPVFMANRDWIRVKAKLVDHILPEDHGDDIKEPERRPELLQEYRKRKLANMITQGAGIGTHGIHHLRNDFKSANQELVNEYKTFDMFNMWQIRAVPNELILGRRESDFEKERIAGMFKLEHRDGKWTIHAQAVMLPVLIHEIIKGMYELVSMHGFHKDRQLMEQVLEYTDTKRNEFMDLKYGEVVYSMVRDFIRGNFHDYTDKKPEILEYYLQSVYEKSAEEMVATIESILTGKADIERIRHTIRGIYEDLKRDETEA